MLVSIFTPTHNARYLADVYRSLAVQTFKDWEWIVLANGPKQDAVLEEIRKLAKDDPRIHPAYVRARGVGALKKAACDRCTGDLLVEVDHDDVLTPDCLEFLVDAYAKTIAVTDNFFLYSQDVTCDFAHTTCQKFMPDFGWEHRRWQSPFDNRFYDVNVNFPVTARSLCEILYAPDHIRAWSRVAYELTGGHDPKMDVADDHDLIVRTYLAGAEFVEINRPLYFHRLADSNTSQHSLEEIQYRSGEIRNQNTHALVAEWCRRSKLGMFDFGGAHNCPPGYLPVDLALPTNAKGIRADVFDFLESAPDNSIGCIRCSDFLEHVEPKMIPLLMLKIWQKLVPGGWLLAITPAVSGPNGEAGRGAFQDPTHVSFWSPNNFWYFVDREFAKYLPCPSGQFQAVRLEVLFPSHWHKLNVIPYVYADLCALKGQRQPGMKFIG